MRERTGSRWRVIPLLVVLLGLVTAGTVPATADEGWTIETFDVAISVQPDATMTVRETLQVDFNSQQHHGIFRDIPVLYEWDQRHNRAYDLAVDSVTDVSGRRSWSYQVLDNGVYKEIKIGDPNQTLSGRQSYVIAYTVKGALNGFNDHDELYWNVTGNQWAVPIKEASATITVPAGGLLWTHCFQGETGSRETCRESSTAGEGDFAATRVLDAGQQLTVVVGMKKGIAGDVAPILRAKPRTFLEYFSVEPLTVGSALLLLLLGLAWLGRLVWRRGRDMEYSSAYYSTKDPTERVRPLFRPEAVVPEYRPPDNLRPAQLGLILDEIADTKDLTATIVDMAVRGYLVIKDVKNGKHDWELVPVKADPRDLLPYEEKLFHGLFEGSSTGTRLSGLKGTFSGTLHAAERLLYGDSVRLKWFTTDPQSALGVAGRPGCGGRCRRYLGPGGAGRLGPAGYRRHPDRRGDDRGQPLDAAPDRAGHRSFQKDAGIPPLHDARGEGSAGVRGKGGDLHPVPALRDRLRLRAPLGKGVRGHRHERRGLELVPGRWPVLSGGLRQ